MHGIELWGHRGARGLFPENTTEGIGAALALGLDGVEIDVVLTADGVPVLSHEPSLSPDLVRGPDGRWLDGPAPLIRDLPADALARFDVGRLRPGSPTAARFPRQVPIDGALLPRLDAVLAFGARCVIELKTFPDRPGETASPETMAEAVASAVDRVAAGPRVVIEAFDWRGPRHLRRTRPDLALAWLTRAETELAAPLWWDGPAPSDFGGSVPRAVAAEGTAEGRRRDIWAPEHPTLTRARIEEAHALGLRVLAWTVNDPADVARMIAWGVDGVITDRPDTARRVMAEAGLKLPPIMRHPVHSGSSARSPARSATAAPDRARNPPP